MSRASRLAVFSHVLLKGVTQETLPQLKSVSGFSDILETDSPEWDEWAAEHYHHIQMNVYPNAAMYLDSSGMLGGPVPALVLDFYRQAGFSDFDDAEGVDHIGHELRFLDSLVQSASSSTDARSLLKVFLEQHLLWWAPLFCHALARQEHPLFSLIAKELLVELETIAAEVHVEVRVQPNFDIENQANPLDDPDTRLKDIARYLLTPVLSGMLLTKDRISDLGRAFKLPRGFGDRLQILTNLIRTAVDYELVSELLSVLENETASWEKFYHTLAADSPVFAPFLKFWEQRIQSSHAMLHTMVKEIG